MPASTKPDRLYFTEDDEANRLLAADPMALLIGFVLDQQVSVLKAFGGPLELKRRLGTIDARQLADMDPARLEAAFRERPALHRFPGNMARRTQDLAKAVVAQYNGDPARIWEGVTDARELQRRLLELPGIGEMKATTLVGILAKRYAIRPSGWEQVAPHHPTLADVDSLDSLERYRSNKAAYKAEMRAGNASR